MLRVEQKQPLKRNVTLKSNQSSFRKILTGEIREMLNESILIRASVKIHRDIRILEVTKGKIKMSIQRQN